MKILLATDGSDFSKAAIDVLADVIAKPQNSSVKLISAVERPMPMVAEPYAISAEYYSEIEAMTRKQAKEFVEEAEAKVRSMFPEHAPEITTEVIDGSPQRIIVERAEEWGADLIIVGSHGYGFWSRVMLGSVSNAVFHNAPCSVMVVRVAHEPAK